MRPKIFYKPERCIWCKYDLAGHEVGQHCPECGKVIRHSERYLPRIRTETARLIDDPPRLTIYLLIFAGIGFVIAIVLYHMLPEELLEAFREAGVLG